MGVDQQVVDLGGDRLHRGGALLGPAQDHRAFLRGDDEGGKPAAAVLGQMNARDTLSGEEPT